MAMRINMQIHATQQAAYVLLFVENTSQIVLYKGERDGAPDVCTLLGGKIGPENPADEPMAEPDDPHIRNLEYTRPWIGLLRELGEEAGHDVCPQNICYAFDFICPYTDDKALQIHVHTASVTMDQVDRLQPQNGMGSFVLFDLNDQENDPFANAMAISPMNNDIIRIYKDHGMTGKTYLRPMDFMPVRTFQKEYSMQRGL